MKFAAKRLTDSDLTLFESYFRQHGTSKQKGINLNGDVLASVLYPALPGRVEGTFEIPLTLDIYGPDTRPLQRLRRKIIKPEGGKNWRLNGKLIEAPREDPARYSALTPGDVAIFAFEGERRPEGVVMVLFTAQAQTDAPLLEHLTRTLGLSPGRRSMVPLTYSEIGTLVAAMPLGHPISLLLPDETREEDLIKAAAGDVEAEERLYVKGRAGATRPVSGDELRDNRARAEAIGRAGEALINAHLTRAVAADAAAAVFWAAEQNAVSPYDFLLTTLDGAVINVEVKSTSGGFDSPFHISAAELTAAADGRDYRIFRVYKVDSVGGARLRRSGHIGAMAQRVLDALNSLPAGIRVGSVQLNPALLTWSAEEELRPTDDEDD